MLAEVLSRQPMDVIAKRIVSMGFNYVRYTWPVFLVTNDSLASLTVRQSFQRLGFVESIAEIQANNPSIIDVPLIKAYQTVVSSLGKNNLMVILDNHISKPGWCCSNLDDYGFFGDKYFNPDQWITRLTRMATLFNGVTNVVGMSLRNELRGPKPNVNDWYKHMQKGAEAVHSVNPNVLVILSGFDFDRDLSFIQTQPVKLTFSGKLVFEAHWYGLFDGPQTWVAGNPNEVCGRVATYIMKTSGYLFDQGYPLFISELGIDQTGTNVNGNRNSSFIQRISALQAPFRGPGLLEAKMHKVIFPPLTVLCITRKSFAHRLRLGPCTDSYAWSYNPKKALLVTGTHLCLQADKSGTSAKLGIFCSGSNSKWEMISDSKMYLSAKLRDGNFVCLDVASDNTIISNRCKCINKDNTCDPSSQWFKLVDSTRSSTNV
ncbi:Cytochrome P450 86A2 [Hibiscus syriacus]|uniref:Cytochrome P450 86A2 n=1 Tax=Hibiscus syriacus TaxID=106335 RepID=A0A6A2XUG2_HIBSY|nr:Cytochrome P450 86A2 [Hibiscus syriacus]